MRHWSLGLSLLNHFFFLHDKQFPWKSVLHYWRHCANKTGSSISHTDDQRNNASEKWGNWGYKSSTNSCSPHCWKKQLSRGREHRTPIINRVHAHTKANGWARYEQDPWNIVGCRVVTRAGRTDGQMAQDTTIPYDPNGLRVKIIKSSYYWSSMLVGLHLCTEHHFFICQTDTKYSLSYLTLMQKWFRRDFHII